MRHPLSSHNIPFIILIKLQREHVWFTDPTLNIVVHCVSESNKSWARSVLSWQLDHDNPTSATGQSWLLRTNACRGWKLMKCKNIQELGQRESLRKIGKLLCFIRICDGDGWQPNMMKMCKPRRNLFCSQIHKSQDIGKCQFSHKFFEPTK